MDSERFASDTTVRSAGHPALTLAVDGAIYTVAAGDGPVAVGSGFPTQIVVDDARVACTHLVVQAVDQGWVCTDGGRNGVFVGGVARSRFAVTGGLIVHLGDPDGIAVEFGFSDGPDPPDVKENLSQPSQGHGCENVDPTLLRVGEKVAARRRELGLAQRTLARDKVINAGTLIDVEKGRRWPRERTRARLEHALQWAPGSIDRLRAGPAPGPGADLKPRPDQGLFDLQTECMSQAVELAVTTLEHNIAELPEPPAPDFSVRASAILKDLRRLETVASNAARGASGAPSLMRVLSEVRQTYRDLMLGAARSPRATLGQALYAARRRAELSVEEAARAAGVRAEMIVAAESDEALTDEDRQPIERLLDTLEGRRSTEPTRISSHAF